MGARRSTVVGIPPKGLERNIARSVVVATAEAVQRTTDKLVFAVSPHRLYNSPGSPLTPFELDKWTKDMLFSCHSLLTALIVGPVDTFSAAPLIL